MAKKGGYQMVVLATLTYAQALAYLECGKPLLIYDGVNKPYYADSIEVDENENVVIRKGASSIVVASDDTKTFNNVLNGALMENIVDKDGHPRFIEGDIEINSNLPEGVSVVYNKWALSGTHLSLVIAGSIASDTTLPIDILGTAKLPKWIMDKIYGVWGTPKAYIERKNVMATADTWATQVLDIYIRRYNDWESGIEIRSATSVTMSTDKSFRISFDLLIDNE